MQGPASPKVSSPAEKRQRRFWPNGSYPNTRRWNNLQGLQSAKRDPCQATKDTKRRGTSAWKLCFNVSAFLDTNLYQQKKAGNAAIYFSLERMEGITGLGLLNGGVEVSAGEVKAQRRQVLPEKDISHTKDTSSVVGRRDSSSTGSPGPANFPGCDRSQASWNHGIMPAKPASIALGNLLIYRNPAVEQAKTASGCRGRYRLGSPYFSRSVGVP